jgi:preprotein translocase subunit YajC
MENTWIEDLLFFLTFNLVMIICVICFILACKVRKEDKLTDEQIKKLKR